MTIDDTVSHGHHYIRPSFYRK